MPSMENSPHLWSDRLPWPSTEGNKYHRGHAVVLGGPVASTGASKLAARACLRAGAGLVSIACSPASLMVYAIALEAVMTKVINDAAAFETLLSDDRITACLLGPGSGVNGHTLGYVLEARKVKKPCVLDADALSVFETAPDTLFAILGDDCVLTPHEGEFARLFGPVRNRLKDATRAAKTSGAVMVLKGSETIIAAPDGSTVINPEAPAWLATAGSGDVLAGIITGLMAQGMSAFAAACAGVWLHSEAARAFGPGLIAEDLPDQLPRLWTGLEAGYWGQTPGFHG